MISNKRKLLVAFLFQIAICGGANAENSNPMTSDQNSGEEIKVENLSDTEISNLFLSLFGGDTDVSELLGEDLTDQEVRIFLENRLQSMPSYQHVGAVEK